MSNRLLVATIAAFGIAGAAFVGSASAMGAKAFMKTVDTNADKTISKDEVDTYAKKRFGELEADNDKTLDDKELKGRLSTAGMRRADTDKDKTVDEAEFVGYVDTLFHAANKKGDKTLSVPELETTPGQKLIKLLQ